MKGLVYTFWLLMLIGLSVLGLSDCQVVPPDEGKQLYISQCASCHMEDGSGLAKLYPPLKNADYLAIHQDDLACIIRNGMGGKILVNGVSYEEYMPGNAALTEVDIANIINYISRTFDKDVRFVTAKSVAERLNLCPPAPQILTR